MLIVLAWLFGIIGLGLEIGERFTKAIHQTWAPVLSAGFGTFLLMFVVGAFGLIPCIGWIPEFLIGMVGIGAVVMTTFGSRPLHRPGMTASSPDPSAAGAHRSRHILKFSAQNHPPRKLIEADLFSIFTLAELVYIP